MWGFSCSQDHVTAVIMHSASRHEHISSSLTQSCGERKMGHFARNVRE